MKSIIQKGIVPVRTQSQDNKFQTSRPCELRRSGQVTTFVVCAVLSLSFQAVVLKSVQSALSDLKRPPERLQSQCNYQRFIT